jgi:hypothetical protein
MASTSRDLRDDTTLGYKLRILIHDVCNVAKEPSSQQRLEAATDELYLSPYFNNNEATTVRNALVTNEFDMDNLSHDNEADIGLPTTAETWRQFADGHGAHDIKTVEQAIHSALAGFFDKRKASGDARPCGPHTLAPVYLDVFGLSRSDIQDERFLARLRRQGVPQVSIMENTHVEKASGENTKKKGEGAKAAEQKR